MASPQKENGYTAIANEILEIILETQFNATQLKIILMCWRYTYGFQRKEAEMSETFIANKTRISKRYISSALKELIERKVLVVVKESGYTTPRTIKFNKDYEKWGKGTMLQQMNNASTVEQQNNTTVEQLFNTTDEQYFHQEIKPKENIKERANSDFEKLWSLYPNKKGKGNISEAQIKKLYSIGIDELTRCIDRYKQSKEEWKAWQQGSTFFKSGYIDYLDANYEEEPKKKSWGWS
jgi:phage replication O-like protein O